MLLSLGAGRNIDPATVVDLDRVFDEETFEGDAQLGDAGGREWIRVRTRDLYGDSGEYLIQWRNPAWPEMRATRESLTVGQAREAFAGYLLGRDWHSGLGWAPWEPVKVRIPYDPDCGRFPLCGRLDDGTLFMAFVTGEQGGAGAERRWVAVLHQFDADGNHLRSESRIGGYDGIGIDVAGERADAELAALTAPILPRVKKVGDVFIRPFKVTLNGVVHGLIYDDTYEGAIFCPRDVWFYFPWDTGDYDT
jgi:hypothetical protein